MFCGFPPVWGTAHAEANCFQSYASVCNNFAFDKPTRVHSIQSVDVRVGVITMGSSEAVLGWHPKKRIIMITDDVER